MKKKVVKIAAGIILLLVGTLIAAPFILEGKIGQILKTKVNNSINGSFDFAEADLSLFRSFPNAELRIKDAVLLNNAPFEGDTLFKAGQIDLTLSIYELFKDATEPIQLKRLSLDQALLNVQINEAEEANYDIAKETSDSGITDATESSFTLDLQEYIMSGSRIIYNDLAGGMYVEVSEIEHSGSGDLSLKKSELQTTSEALVSFKMDGTEYLNRNEVALEALIGIDLETFTFTFLKNSGRINQLPLVFEGFVQVADDYNEVDINFQTPSSDFKNFLALFPEQYSKDIKDVATSGNFMVEGEFKGKIDDIHIPTFRIDISSDEASFKYPDLPKAVEKIVIKAEITNETGLVKDTYVTIEKASFGIDQDRFAMNAKVWDLTANTKVDARIDANMNLANLSRAYPYAAEKDLKGLLKANVTTAFDMASLDKKQYANTRTSGQLSIEGFEYSNPELTAPVQFQSVALDFKPEQVNLNKMQGTMGKTDFNVTGTLKNLLGFMFNKEEVEGSFNLTSNTFSLNDFMVNESADAEAENKKSSDEAASIKIPSFLDCTINAKAQTVLYDNLVLKNVEGVLRIKDETATISNLTSTIFNGKLVLNGEVTTKEVTPTFAMRLGAEQFQLSEAFNELALLKVLAPVASALQGKLNSTIELSGKLNQDFVPNLSSITGDVLAELFDAKISPEKANVLNALAAQLNFFKPEKLNLNGLKTALSFKDGVVTVKPITFSYQDIGVTVNGSHSFDKNLNYKATLQVPAKYLGSEVTNLIAKIDDNSLQSLTIPVGVAIGGPYNSPKVTTDLTTGVKDLTASLIEIQKQKLMNQGKEKASTLLEGLLAGKKGKTDSTTTNSSTSDAVKETLGGILASNAKKGDTIKKDSTTAEAQNDAVKEAAKSVLGGLLKKKKKDTVVVKKDSIK